MKPFPKGGLLGKASALLDKLTSFHIPVHAASASFFIILSVFPALVLLLSLLRYTSLDVHAFVALLEGLIPAALLPAAEKIILNVYQSSSNALVSVSAVTALWSASKGLHGLLIGLNAVYGVSESRSGLYTRLISVGYTFGFFLVMLLTLVLHVFGTTLLDLLESAQIPLFRFLTDIIDLRFFLLVFLQTAVFTAMYMALPNQKNRLSDSLPGALLSSVGWLVFSHLFSLYVEHFSRYSGVYGSVYGIALCMLWLYCCVSILFYGGALNYFLAKDSL